ncbi:MAG: VCBS repeat-containing protein [Phycisphaerales bacterium]|nr:VCBS repeat-containing protein [Phycisphaerales bacterium]
MAMACMLTSLVLVSATTAGGVVCDDISFDAAIEYQLTTVGDDRTFLRCVATGDVDLDGDIDVLVSDRYGEEILIMMNDGAGALSYGGAVVATGCERNRIILLEDLNGDGLLDIASASRGGAAIFLNQGSEEAWLGFSDVDVYPSGVEPHWIDAADLDLDGDQDLLVADFGEEDAQTGWNVFLNDGDGTFADGIPFILGFNARCIAIDATDLDGDGDADITVAGARLNGSFIHVYRNLGSDGAGGWLGVEYQVPIPVPIGACSIRPIDVELDGDFDLAVAHRSQPKLSLLMNNGAGVLEANELSVPTSIELAEPVDANGDGFMDIAVVVKQTAQLRVLRNDGSGLFQSEGTTFCGTDPKFVAFGDLDDDGDLDGVVANSYPAHDYGSVSVHFNATSLLESGCALDLDCNDLVSTGDLLIVLADWGPGAGADGDVNGDDSVDINDLLLVISSWGPCDP